MSLAPTDLPADFSRETPAHLTRPDEDRVLQEPRHRSTRPAPQNGVLVVISQFDQVSDWIGEIKEAWSRGTSSTMDLARVVSLARKRLAYGQWEQVLKSLPFSKRKATMLATVGKGFTWLDGQTSAHLPTGWSVLYQLAQLGRAAVEQMVQEGVIHPKLKLQEAKDLVAKFKGRSKNKKSRRTHLKRRLHQFRDYIRRNLTNWEAKERELAERELTRLLELIRGGAGDGFDQDVSDDRIAHRPSQTIFPTRRTTTLRSSQQSVTTL